MVAQLDPTDWHIQKQKLLSKADNYIGRKNDIICYELITLQKDAKNENLIVSF